MAYLQLRTCIHSQTKVVYQCLFSKIHDLRNGVSLKIRAIIVLSGTRQRRKFFVRWSSTCKVRVKSITMRPRVSQFIICFRVTLWRSCLSRAKTFYSMSRSKNWAREKWTKQKETGKKEKNNEKKEGKSRSWNSRRKPEFIVVGIFNAGRYEYSAGFILRARRFLMPRSYAKTEVKG